MIKLTALAALLAFSAIAQPQPDRKMVELKHLRGSRLQEAASLLRNFMQPGHAEGYPEMNSVVLRGTPENVAAGEAILRKLDVPPAQSGGPTQSYLLRIYLVEALSEASQDGPIPAEVASAIEQMKKTFQYKSYRLLDTVLMQTPAGGHPEVSGILPISSQAALLYNARIREVAVLDEGKTLSLRNFVFGIKVPVRPNQNEIQYLDAAVQTDLMLLVGQKLVVGKLSKDQSSNSVFLIITAEPAA